MINYTNGYQIFHLIRENDEQGEYCYLRPVGGKLEKVYANEVEAFEAINDLHATKRDLPGEFVILNVKQLL